MKSFLGQIVHFLEDGVWCVGLIVHRYQANLGEEQNIVNLVYWTRDCKQKFFLASSNYNDAAAHEPRNHQWLSHNEYESLRFTKTP